MNDLRRELTSSGTLGNMTIERGTRACASRSQWGRAKLRLAMAGMSQTPSERRPNMQTGLAGKQGFIGVRGAGSAGRSGEAGRAEQADMGDSCVGTMMALAAAAHLAPKYELLARSGPAGLLFDKPDDDLKNPAAAAASAGGAAPPKSFATIRPPITPPITLQSCSRRIETLAADILGSAEL
jgi:hypothetical protein